ncbi:MAG: RNA-guided endonuclease TnpB family protein [Blautia wexlerae]
MANSNRKKARKLQAAKKAKTAEKDKAVKKVKPAEEKPIKYIITAEQQADGTFEFHGGKGGFNIIVQKNKALEPYGKCIHNYGVLLELIPGDKQSAINQQIGNARVVHNDYLSKREEYYKETKKTLTVLQYKKEYLPALKKEKEYLNDTDKFVYENACRNVDDAYNRFFNGLSGFPKYASKTKSNGNSFTTNFTNNNLELKMIDGIPYVKLPKVGCVRFILPKGKILTDIQPHGVTIKAATVSMEPDGSYRIALRMESVIDKPVFPTVINAREIISVDLGLKEFGVFGNLEESIPVPNPRWIQVHEKRLRRFQQSLSRKQYDHKTHTGSNNWEKTRAKIAKEQRKIADQRRDFHHKLSRAITDNCVAFICEDLAVKNMMKSRHLSKSIASVGWSQFLTMVQYKMERAGKYFRKISRWYPSSQTCGCCGYKNTDVKDLGVRKWICPKCGTWHDRDINAQQNIYKIGTKMLQDEGIQIIDGRENRG